MTHKQLLSSLRSIASMSKFHLENEQNYRDSATGELASFYNNLADSHARARSAYRASCHFMANSMRFNVS